eukprot:scaffold1123_cov168-Amphora_coffeaeformis.AAC.34
MSSPNACCQSSIPFLVGHYLDDDKRGSSPQTIPTPTCACFELSKKKKFRMGVNLLNKRARLVRHRSGRTH